MEKLVHPRDLECPFETGKNTALEAFIKLGKEIPNSHLSQSSQSQSQSQNESGKPIDSLNRCFQSALGSFGDIGNATSIVKELTEIIELTLKLLPNKRAYLKTLEAVLSEFLEPEERGGLPEETIREVVKEIKLTHEAIFDLQVDRKFLQELFSLIQQSEAPVVAPVTQKAPAVKRKRARVVLEESDEEAAPEEVDGEIEAEEEEITPSQVEPDQEENPAEKSRAKEWNQPDYVAKKRDAIGSTLMMERTAINRCMEKIFVTLRNKRGYNWTTQGNEIVDATLDDSIQFGVEHQEKLAVDPNNRKEIRICAVRSSKCATTHLYEDTNIRPQIRRAEVKDPRGMKCAHIGCQNWLKVTDLVPDEEYARYLARTAQEQEAEF